jgi:hypothetical protein
MKDSGMSTSAIAQALGRGASTVRDWFTKERPEAVAAAQPVASPPAPEKTVSRDCSLPLPQLSQDIIKREKKLAAKRAAMFSELVVLQKEMTALWRYAQTRFEKDGRSVLRNHMGLADVAMQQSGALSKQCEALGLAPNASYQDMLLAVDRAAKDLSQSARKAIYLLGYTDGMSE